MNDHASISVVIPVCGSADGPRAPVGGLRPSCEELRCGCKLRLVSTGNHDESREALENP